MTPYIMSSKLYCSLLITVGKLINLPVLIISLKDNKVFCVYPC